MKKVIIAKNMMDFLLGIPLAVKWSYKEVGFSPLIFTRGGKSNAIKDFIDRYKPDKVITISCEESENPVVNALSMIQDLQKNIKGVILVSRCFERSEKLWSERINALFGSYIASLNGYVLLWTFEKVNENIVKVIEELGAEEIVLIGNIKVSKFFHAKIRKINPPDIFKPESYINFYQNLEKDIDYSTFVFAFYTPLESYVVLAPLLASIHRAPFALYGHHSDPSLLQKADYNLLKALIKYWKPEYLLAVINPYAITPEWVRRLYSLCKLSSSSSIKVSVGIVTGLTEEDASLLIARRYALPINLSEAIVYDSSSTISDMLSIHGIHVHEIRGDDTKRKESIAYKLFKLLESSRAGVICIISHSNNDRMKFHDFSYMSPNPQVILNQSIDSPFPGKIPPSIVFHGGCHSARISGGIGPPKYSLALNSIRAGAVAYIGTIMHNYSMSIARARLYSMLYKFIVSKKPLGKILIEEINYEISHTKEEREEAELPWFILIGDPKLSLLGCKYS